jgi:hypothetical protein
MYQSILFRQQKLETAGLYFEVSNNGTFFILFFNVIFKDKKKQKNEICVEFDSLT